MRGAPCVVVRAGACVDALTFVRAGVFEGVGGAAVGSLTTASELVEQIICRRAQLGLEQNDSH